METHKGEKHQLSKWSIGHSGDLAGIGILFTREDGATFNLLMDWNQVNRFRQSLQRMKESLNQENAKDC